MCCEIALYPRLGDSPKDTGFQACVSADTKLLTKDGLVQIKQAAELGSSIEIWNGEKFSSVQPVKTGSNRELYRVLLSDGSYLDCTENHKWLVKHRFQKQYKEVTTLELIDVLTETKYPMSTPRPVLTNESTGELEGAYEYGFVLGDGSVHKGTVFASVHKGTGKEKINFNNVKLLQTSTNRLDTEYTDHKFLGLDYELCKELKADGGLPNILFSLDTDSILKFMAGWIDADGCVASKGVRVYGKESDIRDGQLLLRKVGIFSSVNLMAKAGEYVKSIGCTRNRDVWYLQITKTIDIPCQRVLCNNPNEPKYKGKNQVVVSINKLEELHDTYCFEEKELHQGLFNNVLTKQCNLSEINGGQSTTKEFFFEQCQAAAILGTLQAGYTDFKFLNEISQKIVEKEALIGVGITGWMNNPDILFAKETMIEGAEIVKATNRVIAELIDINPAARCCTVKPAGTSSITLSTTSGIHGEHSKRYLRNVQFNKETEIGRAFKQSNPNMVEDSVWSSGNTDYCVSFPVISPSSSIFKSELLGVKQLEYVKLAQQYWVEYGTNVELCSKPYLRHNVSNTITVDDWGEVIDYVYDNKEYLCGVSFLSDFGDKALPQSPFTEVLTLEEIVNKYGQESMFTSGLVEAGLNAFSDNLWSACTAALTETDFSEGTNANILKRDFVRRFKKFAKSFRSEEDCAACLKDVYLLHKWWKIQKSCSNSSEILDNLAPKEYVDINTLGAQACSGGVCDLTW